MNNEMRELVEALQNAIENGPHISWCAALKGPRDETWTEEDDCDCWKKEVRVILRKYEKDGAA